MSSLLLSVLSMRMDVGYPWERLYVDWQVSEKVSFFGLYEQPSLSRIQPCAGLSLVWIDRAWDVSGELMIGSVVQNAQIVKKVFNSVQMTFHCMYSGRLDLSTVILDV